MTHIPITEDFSDDLGRFSDYDAYDPAAKLAVNNLKHRDIRSFQQSSSTALTTMFDLSGDLMGDLSAESMFEIGGGFTTVIGENWSAGTVAPDAARNNFPILALPFTSGVDTVTESHTAATPVDIVMGFDPTDVISVALPAYPNASINAALSYLVLGDENARTVNLPFSATTTALVAGDSELTWPLSLAQASNVDLTAITRVEFIIRGTASATFRASAIRVIASGWTVAAIDMDTRYGRLRRTPSRNGATPVPAFTQPILWRSDDPSGSDDPRPIDANMGVIFNPGTISTTNSITLYFREVTEDFLTQLDIDGETMATLGAGIQPDLGAAAYNPRPQTEIESYDQDELLGEQQTTLERTPDYLSASWIQFKLTWTATGGSIAITDTEGNGYTRSFTTPLTNNQVYVFYTFLEENRVRAAIYPIDGNGNVQSLFFDTFAIIDDSAYKRRKGRFGWTASLLDGNAWIDSITARRLVYGEYRSLPFESVTPVIGAELFVSGSPNVEHYEFLTPGPYNAATNATLDKDTAKSTSGESWRVTDYGNAPSQGVQTNTFALTDFEDSEIQFDLYYPTEPTLNGVSLSAVLFNESLHLSVPLLLPQINPDHWQRIRILFPFGDTVLTGTYRFAIFQNGSFPSTWWIDNISIFSRTLAWEGRATIDDPWTTPDDERWTPFRNILNRDNGGVIFPERGTQLQVRSKALRQGAIISRVQFRPSYAQLGRFVTGTPRTTDITPSFTNVDLGSQTVRFTDTSTHDSNTTIVNAEWSFGDGNEGIGSVVLHQYATAGSYPVTLTVTDSAGRHESTSTTVAVA